MMKALIKIGIAVIALTIGVGATLAILNPGNIAQTSENPADAGLAPRRFTIDKIKYLDSLNRDEKPFIVREIESLLARQTTYGRNWRVIDTRQEIASFTVHAEVPVVIFTDDLQVTMDFKPSPDANPDKLEMVVNVFSQSRVGKSDLGENRRHVKQFLEDLDFAFGNDKL